MAMMEAKGRGQEGFVTCATNIQQDLQDFDNFQNGLDPKDSPTKQTTE